MSKKEKGSGKARLWGTDGKDGEREEMGMERKGRYGKGRHG